VVEKLEMLPEKSGIQEGAMSPPENCETFRHVTWWPTEK